MARQTCAGHGRERSQSQWLYKGAETVSQEDDLERTVWIEHYSLEVDEVSVIVLILSDDKAIASTSNLRSREVDVDVLTGSLRSEIGSELVSPSSGRARAQNEKYMNVSRHIYASVKGKSNARV